MSAYGKYGVDKTMTDCTIESYNIRRMPQLEPVPDQHNAVQKEIKYDTRTELQATVRTAGSSPVPAASDTLTFDGDTYVVDTVEEAGTYNGLLRFNITAHHFAATPSVEAAVASGGNS